MSTGNFTPFGVQASACLELESRIAWRRVTSIRAEVFAGFNNLTSSFGRNESAILKLIGRPCRRTCQRPSCNPVTSGPWFWHP